MMTATCSSKLTIFCAEGLDQSDLCCGRLHEAGIRHWKGQCSCATLLPHFLLSGDCQVTAGNDTANLLSRSTLTVSWQDPAQQANSILCWCRRATGTRVPGRRRLPAQLRPRARTQTRAGLKRAMVTFEATSRRRTPTRPMRRASGLHSRSACWTEQLHTTNAAATAALDSVLLKCLVRSGL